MKLLVLLTILTVAIYATAEEYCIIGDVSIKKGEQGPLGVGECGLATCVNPPDEVAAVGCGVFFPGGNCQLSETDYTKKYPDCCPKTICP